ncbi:AbrB/MazE/SpoVT family DNA-binding domain-containing protein [Cronobacter malonaticus]|uniref:AbrB/MazE/SpoVT family DNA-binding domain-containing protein n=1 Tax=Cronobacter sakazakii TaxID=28141 RepID=UPI00084E2ACB|nr:AbrB/MazE/SpoVT family DNA-binding domain-containing protein [Cronobacter sakazakii]EAV5731188.1 AbrB/MazE/SpoVT family DNA-binding domain-containing protein [Salmonella enterica]EDC9289966.1 AbrB/MazE/SpoVT family DNA-binding domain-containing protein [Salmonella enterica subsp. enterica serovar Enteritidis]EDT3546911.1 AbrB/MazE/SpoVT family DNA-binding domain-containing protein [Salmonella enterica subsp. enterica serovar Thompson]EJI5534769.1 AbrB/MazE/SpoVT family DNA-binding domain-con
MVQVVIKKWGNSPSVRLPIAIMREVALNVDDTVDLVVQDGHIVIVPIKTKGFNLNTLLSGVTTENSHEAIPIGKVI